MLTDEKAILTVIVMGDALEHITVPGGVMVAVNGDIMRNKLQRKNTYYINFQ